MAATVSLSKGVFAFKRTHAKSFKKNENADLSSYLKVSHWRSDKETENTDSKNITLSNYQKEWSSMNNIISTLLHDIHNKVLEDLVEYVKRVGNTIALAAASKDIPTACLVTGVNMPDHDSLFGSLTNSLMENVSPHVVRLASSRCVTAKGAVFKIVNAFMNEDQDDCLDDSDEEDEKLQSPSKKKSLKKKQCNMTVLSAWYKELTSSCPSYESPRKKLKKSPGLKSPRKMSAEPRRNPLIVIVEDLEAVPPNVLQDLILICSEYRQRGLPFVFVLGVSTTPAAVHKYLNQNASSSLAIETFQAQPSSTLLSQVIDKVLMSSMPFKVGGKVFKLLLDIFLFHDLSVHNFIQGLKYCMLEHYLRSPVSELCTNKRKKLFRTLSPETVKELRELPSCVQLVDNLQKEKKKLLEDDEEFKRLVRSELKNLENWFSTFCILVRVLHKLVYKLPGNPLGRQVREVFSTCLSQQMTDCPEFQDSWKILSLSGKQEIDDRLKEVVDILEDYPDNAEASNLRTKLSAFLTDLSTVHSKRKKADVTSSSPVKGVALKPSDRFHLREKLLGCSNPKQLSPFEELRTEILSTFEHLFIVHLKPPSTRPFHEVFFFDKIGAVKYQLLGSVRATVTTGLKNPQKYLQCSCCFLDESESLPTSLPDLSLVYKLHVECGRMINLYDWMQAFIAIVKGSDDDADQQFPAKKRPQKGAKKKTNVDEKLQARFVQAVSELQLLGFIKPTKRKTDHVQRLTWGGC